MNERYFETNVEFLLNLKDVFDEPTTFLMVWWNGNDKKHNCEYIFSRDYETAESYVLRFIKYKKVDCVILYKSEVKVNKNDKYHYFRLYVPISYYDGMKHSLVKHSTLFADTIEISCERGYAWQAIYVEPLGCDYLMQIEIKKNADSVYGRSKKNESL